MSYHFPNERRRIERRATPSPAYGGVERRRGERRQTEVKLVRKAQPMHRGVLYAAVFMILVVADSAFLDGAYRQMLVGGINAVADTIRNAADHVWDWRA